MTKDKLLTRLSLLRQEREQLVARVHMYDGALEEAEYWLGQAEAEEAAKGENGPAAGGDHVGTQEGDG